MLPAGFDAAGAHDVLIGFHATAAIAGSMRLTREVNAEARAMWPRSMVRSGLILIAVMVTQLQSIVLSASSG